VAPGAILTYEGVLADTEFDDRFTINPPVGAAPSRETSPIAGVPPITAFGLMDRLATLVGLIANVADFESKLSVAVILVRARVLTPVVATTNVAESEPEGIVTVDGTEVPFKLELSRTVVPPGPALPSSFMLPVGELPPATD